MTKSGLEIECDFVVIGAGVTPDITLAQRAGLETDSGVIVDRYLETSVPGVFAAGDIAEYDSVVHDRRLRIEHWDVAFNQGKYAALNMLGQTAGVRRRALLLVRPRGLGRHGVRRAGGRLGRDLDPRQHRGGRVHRVLREGRAGRGGAHGRPLRRPRRGGAAAEGEDRRRRGLRARIEDANADIAELG